MKKFIIMLAAALPMVFTSCGDDNDDNMLSLDQSAMTINYDDEVTLKASEKNCTWTSSNPFVATVDANGKVEANHVGQAVITASKDGNIAKCNVTVNATNNNFVMPIITWGNSMDDVKSAMTTLNIAGLSSPEVKGTSLVYTTGTLFPWYIYSFVDEKLASSSLTVSDTMDEEKDLEGFLDQRYEEVGETEYGYVYGNAETLAASTILVEYGYDPDVDAIMAIWAAPKTSKAGNSFNAAAAMSNRKVARELAKK